MWLTRSVTPFVFTDRPDRQLFYEACENLGLYIHIPFCRSICNFCPYCKTVYAEETCSRYVDALLQEIHRTGQMLTARKRVTSLYFGGGTPALAADRMKEIIEVIGQYYIITEGIGVELHPDDVTTPLLETLRDAGVTKISIGIQSFQEKFSSILGRGIAEPSVLSAGLKTVPFETISMDFIFALPGQTFEDLKNDIDTAFQYGANHIAIYPFIDFTFTSSTVRPLPKKEKRVLLDRITAYCLDLFQRKAGGLFLHDQRQLSWLWLFCSNTPKRSV